jgi:hypothetical protein
MVVPVTLALLVSFVLMGAAWSLASPPLSSADEDFHLASIVCAAGDNAFCEIVGPSTVKVPESIIGTPCYQLDPSRGADCFSTFRATLLPTSRLNRGDAHVLPVYYRAMNTILGPNIWLSVVRMRMANSLLAGLLLAWALLVARPPGRRALALAWLVVIFPLGIFHIASINPLGWAIAGVGTCWAFLLAWFEPGARSRARSVAIGAGVVVSALIAVAGRTDSAIYLAATVIAVLVLRLPAVRSAPRRLILLAVLAVPALLAAAFRLPQAVQLVLDRSSAIPADLPGWFLWIHVAEWPYLIAQVLGFPTPRYLPYWGELGYTQGFGWDSRVGPATATELPTVVVIGAATATLLVLGWGLQSYSRRKVAALAIMGTTLVVMSFGWVVGSGYVAWAQARYYVPILLVIVGFVAYVPMRVPRPRALVVGIITLGATLAGVVSLATMIRRSTNGQPIVPQLSWLGFDAYVQWWWPDLPMVALPSPNATLAIGGLATLGYAAALTALAVRPATPTSAAPASAAPATQTPSGG